MWREREKVSWKDVPHVNGTLAPDAGFGKKMYDACVAQCPCAASEGRDDFPALSRALLDPDADATQVPGVCFDESPRYWFHFGWVTTAHWFLIFYLALSILGVWTLACCVSNRCCYAFGTLQKIRNEFADACPTPEILIAALARRGAGTGSRSGSGTSGSGSGNSGSGSGTSGASASEREASTNTTAGGRTTIPPGGDSSDASSPPSPGWGPLGAFRRRRRRRSRARA